MVKKNEKKEIELESIPFVGGLLKGIEKLVDVAERVERAGGEIKRKGEIKGLGGEKDLRGIYGFSIRTGIAGRPQVQTFGNIHPVRKRSFSNGVRPNKEGFKVAETREPIVDVFDEKEHILLIVELPGAAKENIKLDLKGDILILEAGDAKSRYSKEILLPVRVDFAKREMNFKNGVLEIKIPKKRCPQPKKKL